MSEGLPRITLVAAVARNGVIGGGNRLLWRVSSDLQRFKAVTLGKPMIMGRKTWDSIGRPLPGRETIVVTRDPAFAPEGAHVAGSFDEALSAGSTLARKMGADEIIVAGGGEIYALAMEIADRLVVTEVDLAPEGDTVFPAIDPEIWRETARERPERGPKDEAAFTFLVYERR
ncbi:MAG: dihydrofolate reductase [Beijerinckiaceae bacterium]